MKKQNIQIQKKLDNLIDKIFLKYIPVTAKPNYFTYFRIFTVPFIYLFLEHEKYILAFILFVISASTDFIDGALARTRDQITDLGKLLDPIADKMLIATVLLFIGWEYLIVKIFLVFIFFEIASVFSSAVFARYLGRPIGANVFGKIKMVLQSISVILFLIGVIFKIDQIITISIYILVLALVFALLSGIEQIRRKSVEIYTDNIKETK